jgi:hypothetical protein
MSDVDLKGNPHGGKEGPGASGEHGQAMGMSQLDLMGSRFLVLRDPNWLPAEHVAVLPQNTRASIAFLKSTAAARAVRFVYSVRVFVALDRKIQLHVFHRKIQLHVFLKSLIGHCRACMHTRRRTMEAAEALQLMAGQTEAETAVQRGDPSLPAGPFAQQIEALQLWEVRSTMLLWERAPVCVAVAAMT